MGQKNLGGKNQRKLLSKEQEDFARLFVQGVKQDEAYRIAYNKHDARRVTVKNAASVLKNRPLICARIKELREEGARKVTKSCQDKLEIIEKIIDGTFEGDSKIALKAIQVHNQMTGDLAPTKQEITGKIDHNHDHHIGSMETSRRLAAARFLLNMEEKESIDVEAETVENEPEKPLDKSHNNPLLDINP